MHGGCLGKTPVSCMLANPFTHEPMACRNFSSSVPRSFALWFGTLVWACLLGHPARAQIDTATTSAYLTVVGVIRQSSCTSPVLAGDSLGSYVVNLPALQTTLLLNTVFSPVASVPLRLGAAGLKPGCPGGGLGMPTLLNFDAAAAPVQPEGGLLRNTATVQPAQNVLVQVGLISAEGMFTPLDLNQPQRLNQVLNNPGSPASAGLSLGVRYVAARHVPQQWASLGLPADDGALDVTSGNVSVYLPFVLDHK